jgi:hypothetical protein
MKGKNKCSNDNCHLQNLKCETNDVKKQGIMIDSDYRACINLASIYYQSNFEKLKLINNYDIKYYLGNNKVVIDKESNELIKLDYTKNLLSRENALWLNEVIIDACKNNFNKFTDSITSFKKGKKNSEEKRIKLDLESLSTKDFYNELVCKHTNGEIKQISKNLSTNLIKILNDYTQSIITTEEFKKFDIDWIKKKCGKTIKELYRKEKKHNIINYAFVLMLKF